MLDDEKKRHADAAHRWLFDDLQAGMARARDSSMRRMQFIFRVFVLFMVLMMLVAILFSGGGR